MAKPSILISIPVTQSDIRNFYVNHLLRIHTFVRVCLNRAWPLVAAYLVGLQGEMTEVL